MYLPYLQTQGKSSPARPLRMPQTQKPALAAPLPTAQAPGANTMSASATGLGSAGGGGWTSPYLGEGTGSEKTNGTWKKQDISQKPQTTNGTYPGMGGPAITTIPEDVRFSDTSLLTFGFPGMEQVMRELGFTPVQRNGKWYWQPGPGAGAAGYAEDRANRDMAINRDVLEPELQRMLAQQTGAMEARGLGSSSIVPSMQTTARVEYAKEIARKRLSDQRAYESEYWQRLLQAIAAANDQTQALASSHNPQHDKPEQDDGGDWLSTALSLGSAAGGLGWSPF